MIIGPTYMSQIEIETLVLSDTPTNRFPYPHELWVLTLRNANYNQGVPRKRTKCSLKNMSQKHTVATKEIHTESSDSHVLLKRSQPTTQMSERN